MKARQTLLLLLMAFLAVFLEAALDWPRRWLGAQVDVLPALATFAALRMDLKSLVLLSLVGGLFFDSLSSNPFGASVWPLFLVGLGIHIQKDRIVKEEMLPQFVLGALASAVAPLLTLALVLSIGKDPLLSWISVWQWMVMAVGGGIATVVCFWIFDWLDLALTYRPASQPSFRPDREIRRGRY